MHNIMESWNRKYLLLWKNILKADESHSCKFRIPFNLFEKKLTNGAFINIKQKFPVNIYTYLSKSNAKGFTLGKGIPLGYVRKQFIQHTYILYGS